MRIFGSKPCFQATSKQIGVLRPVNQCGYVRAIFKLQNT